MRIVSNGTSLLIPPRGPAGPDGNPIGTIISYMGLTAPKDYLVCDGTVYNISDYPDLSVFIKTQFGSANYFGGDGTSTFAVPDMRNLFLRGYHGEAEEQLSGEVGAKQDGTNHPNIWVTASIVAQPGSGRPTEYDSMSNDKGASNGAALTTGLVNYNESFMYTSRPVNMAVLYCIKAVESVPAENVYSTEEQVVGRWIDGKPVYRKVIDITTGALNVETIHTTLDDVDFMVSNRFVVFGKAGSCVEFPNIYGYVFFSSVIKALGSMTTSTDMAGQPAKAIIEYTKNTDQATTELPAALTAAPAQALFTAASQSAATVTLDAGIKNEEV